MNPCTGKPINKVHVSYGWFFPQAGPLNNAETVIQTVGVFQKAITGPTTIHPLTAQDFKHDPVVENKVYYTGSIPRYIQYNGVVTFKPADGGTKTWEFVLARNGTSFVGSMFAGTHRIGMNMTCPLVGTIYLTPGDYVELQVGNFEDSTNCKISTVAVIYQLLPELSGL